MLIKLSMDTWRDVFDFLGLSDRKELALKCNGIGDRQFNGICQKWLHEWTKNVCLGSISVIQPPKVKWCRQRGKQNIKIAEPLSLECQSRNDLCWKEAPLAEVELPENIRDFQMVECSYLDATVFQFLCRLQPLFRNVNLYVDSSQLKYPRENAQKVLCHLLPLISGIDSVSLEAVQLLFTIRDRFPAHFMSIKQLEVLNVRKSALLTIKLVELLLQWLGTRRTDGQHRTLILSNFNGNPLEFIDRIRQYFLTAISQVDYFVWISTKYWRDFNAIQNTTTQNAGTNEQLMVRKVMVRFAQLAALIGRCPSEMDGQKWMEEMGKRIVEAYGQTAPRNITVSYPTLGQMESEEVEGEREEEMEVESEEDEDVDQQPGPSNKKQKKLF